MLSSDQNHIRCSLSIKQIRSYPRKAEAKKTASRRVVKKKVTLSADDNIISDDPDAALELDKSISQMEVKEAEVTRKVHATHARIVTESVSESAKKNLSGRRYKSVVIQATPSAPKSKPATLKTKLKGASYLSLQEQETADIMQALKERTGAKPGVLDEDKDITREKVILEWGDKQDSKHSDDYNDDAKKDEKDGDADDEGDDHDEDEEMNDAEVEGFDKGNEEITNASKEEAENTSKAKDDTKKTKLPPSSSSLSVSLGFGHQFLKLSFDFPQHGKSESDSYYRKSPTKSLFDVGSSRISIFTVKENQEKDKIRSKPDKNGKRGESSHWQYKFPLLAEGVPTARSIEIPLPGVCTAMMKKLPVKDRWRRNQHSYDVHRDMRKVIAFQTWLSKFPIILDQQLDLEIKIFMLHALLKQFYNHFWCMSDKFLRDHFLCIYWINFMVLVNFGSESRPPMLNKENYVPWSSRLLRYAKSRPNGKLIHNSILNGPYVRRMIPEPGDAKRDVNVNETFHEQTNDELSEKELKQIKVDDQAIQTIILGLSEDIYATVDSCETAQEIWL
nr:hypothetical protein [Tanacetum cinerariifolium]